MNRYKVTSNYGTFEITKIVLAESEEDAYDQTGIMVDLIMAGWHVNSYPDGEEHEIKEITS